MTAPLGSPVGPPADQPAVPATASRARRWLPEPTPQTLLPQPGRMAAWAAYAGLLVIYVVVFSRSLGQTITLFLTDRQFVSIPAPGPDTYWAMALPGWIMHAVLLALTLLWLWIVTRVLRLRIGQVFAPDRDETLMGARQRRVQGWQVFTWAFVALLVWMGGSTLLESLLPTEAVGGFIIDDRADAVWTSLMLGPAQVTTALVEEPIVVGLLVLVLIAARRPAWEIYTVAVVAKVAYHAYYGLPVLAMVPAALVIVWLYHRTGRLWPIIVAHAAYNLCFSALVIALPHHLG